jgi:Uri superfamily endonuclease
MAVSSNRTRTGVTVTGTDTERGTYTLLVTLREAATIEVGALGERTFPAGWYAYTGSAFGPGGFARVERHRELGRGARDTRQWHIDYLLGHPVASVETDIRTAGADIECAVARSLATDCTAVAAFGASDCDCGSHLAFAEERDALLAAAEGAHASHRR